MKKQIEVANTKLSFTKETVANLSEQELDQLVGGQDAEVASTRTNFTCGWCTSTTAVEEAN